MGMRQDIWATPIDYLTTHQPEEPVLFHAPAVLQATARRFLAGFDGLVTYAVKANPDPFVLENIIAAGVRGFDVASPQEMALVHDALPGATLHYHNPVRSEAEIRAALHHKVASYSVDSLSELEKLAIRLAPGTEVAVRFKLPVSGGLYDFGAKFGATEDGAVTLLQAVARAGLRPALTFHPGTQCTDPQAWVRYIVAAADIARRAGVPLARLNVGGGFPADRGAGAPDWEAIFAAIRGAADAAFGADAPMLVCEPGRALVAGGISLAARVKSIRDADHVFLNDGIYGGLAEAAQIGALGRVEVLAPDGHRRSGPPVSRTVFGPTCDSLDQLPGQPALPADMAEGDYVLFHGQGAYCGAIATRFNGYGALSRAMVLALEV